MKLKEKKKCHSLSWKTLEAIVEAFVFYGEIMVLI